MTADVLQKTTQEVEAPVREKIKLRAVLHAIRHDSQIRPEQYLSETVVKSGGE